jgi:hypothetical protein
MGRFLTPTERDIWERFKTTQLPELTDFYYETPIVRLSPECRYIELHQVDWWTKLTAFKADVIFNAAGDWHLVEVEEELNTESIGQAVAYTALWNNLNPGIPIKQTWIVTAGHDPRLEPALKAAGITHFLVNQLPTSR